jgi:hypothetical protein
MKPVTRYSSKKYSIYSSPHFNRYTMRSGTMYKRLLSVNMAGYDLACLCPSVNLLPTSLCDIQQYKYIIYHGIYKSEGIKVENSNENSKITRVIICNNLLYSSAYGYVSDVF